MLYVEFSKASDLLKNGSSTDTRVLKVLQKKGLLQLKQ